MKQTKPKLFHRKCPLCDSSISYTTKQQCKYAAVRKSKCNKCKFIHRKRRSNKVTNKILILHKKGLLNKEIASIVGISRESVSQKLKQNGRKSHFFSKRKLNIIDDKFGICKSCGEKLELNKFADGRNGQYKHTSCHKCRYAKTRRNTLSSLDNYFKYAISHRKRKAKQRGLKFDLDINHMIKLYNDQKGKCFYTGNTLAMLRSTSDNNNLCIDRVDNKIGYIKTNIVLSTIRFNRIKSDLSLLEIKQYMPPIYKKIIKKFPHLKVVND